VSIRVYLPLTLASLADAHRSGVVPTSGERFVAADEDEQSEYDALMAAADASAALLDAPGRRVVLVADVADPDAAISMDDVVACHVDLEDDADPDDDLGWFATQEIPDLL
jgi:hypothetical protein